MYSIEMVLIEFDWNGFNKTVYLITVSLFGHSLWTLDATHCVCVRWMHMTEFYHDKWANLFAQMI